MTTSGSTDFNTTRNQIIRFAALDLTAIPAGTTPGAQIVADFAFSLNAMVKAWGASGIHVWEVKDATLFPAVGQVKYAVGPSATAHVTESYVETATTSNVLAGATTIPVSSTTGVAVNDFAGIVLDSGALQWSTVASKTSSTIVIADALSDVVASGNAVFAYTTKISRPLNIPAARRYNIDAATDTPIIMVSRDEYNMLSVKRQTGTANQLFYDKQIPQGQIYLWQPLAAIDTLVKFTWHKVIDDFDAAGNSPDLPQEWIMALRYNLAQSMYSIYPVTDSQSAKIDKLAGYYLDLVMGHDREDESIYMVPDMSPH